MIDFGQPDRSKASALLLLISYPIISYHKSNHKMFIINYEYRYLN